MSGKPHRLLLLIGLACAGCGARRTTDLLEAKLRQQEDRIASLNRDLETARAQAESAQRESGILQAKAAGQRDETLLPEQAEVLFSVQAIRFSSLLTGALDRDGNPGDDVLNVVLQPVDADGELLKVPGSLKLELLDLSRDSGRQTIADWSWTVDESRTLWSRGAFGSGFVTQVPLPARVTSTELLLHARLTTIDGRQFDTSRTIRIEPPSEKSPADSETDRKSV